MAEKSDAGKCACALCMAAQRRKVGDEPALSQAQMLVEAAQTELLNLAHLAQLQAREDLQKQRAQFVKKVCDRGLSQQCKKPPHTRDVVPLIRFLGSPADARWLTAMGPHTGIHRAQGAVRVH